jgi:hypothetical protein
MNLLKKGLCREENEELKGIKLEMCMMCTIHKREVEKLKRDLNIAKQALTNNNSEWGAELIKKEDSLTKARNSAKQAHEIKNKAIARAERAEKMFVDIVIRLGTKTNNIT